MAKKRKKGGFKQMDFLIVGGIAIVAYFLFSSFSKGPIDTGLNEGSGGTTPPPPPPDNPTGPTLGPSIQNDIFFTSSERNTVLKLGSTGLMVKALQFYLLKAGRSLGPYGADGDFGTATQSALMAEKGSATITLKDLGIEAIRLSTGQVFGKDPDDFLQLTPQEFTTNGWV